ncbi:MAG: hypothetical protein OXC07_05385 [Kistimonas sp.]|nr:hypothetical protein [Kistimonas sp.]
MNPVAAPVQSQDYSRSAVATGRDCAQAPPVDTLCAGYREALDGLASSLCQYVLVDDSMEFKLHKDEGGFLESHEVSRVQRQSDSVQKMEQILSMLRTKDDQAFHGFIEWLRDSDSRSWGQMLAERAGLSTTATPEQGGGYLGRKSVKRRPVVEPDVIPAAPDPGRSRTGAAVSSGDMDAVSSPVRNRMRRNKTLCQRGIEWACYMTGVWCGSYCGLVAGFAFGNLPSLIFREEIVQQRPDFLVMPYISGFVFGMAGGLRGAKMGLWVGRKISGLLDRPAQGN